MKVEEAGNTVVGIKRVVLDEIDFVMLLEMSLLSPKFIGVKLPKEYHAYFGELD